MALTNMRNSLILRWADWNIWLFRAAKCPFFRSLLERHRARDALTCRTIHSHLHCLVKATDDIDIVSAVLD
jgi:hypothetical protein